MRIALLVALTAGFPFIVYFIASTAGRGTSGAGGAIAVVMGLYLKPLIYVLFALSLLRPAARRARTLGMTLAVGPALALAIIGDLAFGTLFLNHWGVGFMMGALHLPFPWLLASALVAIIALAALADRDDGMLARERFGAVYPIWFVLIVLLALHGFALVMILLSAGLGVAPRKLLALTYVVSWLPRAPLAIALIAASLWLIVRDKLSGGGASPAVASPQPRPAASPVGGGPARAAFGLRRA
jgi:hypothetical protein